MITRTVFCDWLDVTYSRDDSPLRKFDLFLDSINCSVHRQVENDSKSIVTTWHTASRGVIKTTRNKNWKKISLGGSALETIRELGVTNEMLTLLSDAPYQITRVDLAYDIAEDAPAHVESLIKKYPKACRLLRKHVATKRYLETREDGETTGTFYVGGRKTGGVTARVYDKQRQMLDVFHEKIPPRVRYEITVKKSLPVTLNDVANPESLFWHVASPSLLTRPAHVHNWKPADPDDIGWIMKMPDLLPYKIMQTRVETSPELERLIQLADELGSDGRGYLVDMISKRLQVKRGDSVQFSGEGDGGERAA